MSSSIFLRLGRGLGRFGESTGRVLTAFTPIGLALAAMGSIWSLTTAYAYEISASEGPSMEPTIPNVTNTLGVNKTYRNGRGIKIGDCVQIASPLHPNVYLGKRVIGLPGDYVLRSRGKTATPGGAPMPGVTDWKKRFAIDRLQENGNNLASLVGDDGENDDSEWEEPEMIQVPEGHVWVEGDNLAWSRDSRVFGAVPMALIRGRSGWYSVGPFSRTSLSPGKGLQKVEKEDMADVLGEDGEVDSSSTGRR